MVDVKKRLLEKLHPDRNIGDIEFVERSWKERLFTWPWNPFNKYKTLECNMVYRVNGEFICSYKTYEILKKELNATASDQND